MLKHWLLAGVLVVAACDASKAPSANQASPAPAGDLADCEIEVRQLFELDDFAPSESIDRFKQLDASLHG